MNEQLNTLIYKLMGGGGDLSRLRPEKVVRCLLFYWRRRRSVSSLADLPPDDRRLTVLLLRHSWGLPIAQIQTIFNKSRATIMRDLNYIEWKILKDKKQQQKYTEIYNYLSYYVPLYYR